MKTQGVWIGVLVGAVVALAGLLVATNLPSAPAQAQGGGGGGGAGNTIAISQEFLDGQNLLYVIDNTAKTILVYGLYQTARSKNIGEIRRTSFDLVAGRNFQYDAAYVSKAGLFGNTRLTPRAVEVEAKKLKPGR